jgi:hypothetical protein
VSLFVLPMETFGETAVKSQLGELVGKIVIFGLSGALWAMLGMLLSTVTMNTYMAYAAPFILYYVLIILQERYARDIFMLNPQNYLTLTGTWPFGGWSAGSPWWCCHRLHAWVLCHRTGSSAGRHNARKSIRTLFRQRSISLEKPFHPARDIPMLNDLRQVRSVVRYNFRMWRGNARVLLTFALAFILCFLLSTKQRRLPTTWARRCRRSSRSSGRLATRTPYC